MKTNKKICLAVCILLLKLLSFSAVLPNSAKLSKQQRQQNSQFIPNNQGDILASQNLKADKKYILNGLS